MDVRKELQDKFPFVSGLPFLLETMHGFQSQCTRNKSSLLSFSSPLSLPVFPPSTSSLLSVAVATQGF